MQAEPEVLPDHTELICSTNIVRIVTGRNPSQRSYEDDYFSIRYFQKGTGHLTFKRPDINEKMNDIIVKYYF